MDKTAERETHDFMNVETFSQLPFIRPAPPPKGSGAGAIRLFGQEFKAKTTTGAAAASDEENNSNKQEQADPTNKDNTEDQTMTSSSSSNRKFECHYCCRNFPTSQALGGHQNAHKRERQHAKRAHLQSSMGLSDAHVYAGLMNYSTAASRLGSAQLPIAYNHHSSWNNNSTNSTPYLSGAGSTRLYGSSHGASFGGGHHHQTAAPINGSPLAMWRVPAAAHGSSVFSSHDHQRSLQHHHSQISSFNNKNVISRGGNIGSQSRFGYETKGSMQDHVSLDLHL